ncbi:MAG: glycosyltransferase family 4 protein [Gammaproteobacteria bacterium]|nr:glycosyltransferase family 4 protein [Gammaproteobacteria bacterium]
MTNNNTIIILGGARDFHAIDSYRAVRKLCPERTVIFVTDLFGGEGYPNLAKADDNIKTLLVIDDFLCSKFSIIGNYWRNIIKVLVTPIQVIKLRHIIKVSKCSIVHAHPMYYMFLCWLARVPFVGTPQGDEMFFRPKRSRLYKYIASKVLRAAKAVVIDSYQMKDAVKKISGVDAFVIQNGVNVDEITSNYSLSIKRVKITSIRGMEDLYRINDIVLARNNLAPELKLTFIYPFYDSEYLPKCRNLLMPQDDDLGRLNKDDMYKLFYESVLIISIPRSDSSPRSVYEAIFSGCCVAVTPNPWIDLLPACMRERIYIVDLENESWLIEAYKYAEVVTKKIFVPSEEALNLFDENRSLLKVVEQFY